MFESCKIYVKMQSLLILSFPTRKWNIIGTNADLLQCFYLLHLSLGITPTSKRDWYLYSVLIHDVETRRTTVHK